jgi:hypothetical protein
MVTRCRREWRGRTGPTPSTDYPGAAGPKTDRPENVNGSGRRDSTGAVAGITKKCPRPLDPGRWAGERSVHWQDVPVVPFVAVSDPRATVETATIRLQFPGGP